ncbi:hypothetical protein AAE478_009547 [Parahypoxylon ruwenzoriense]
MSFPVNKCPINKCPPEVLAGIVKLLPQKDAMNLALTSKGHYETLINVVYRKDIGSGLYLSVKWACSEGVLGTLKRAVSVGASVNRYFIKPSKLPAHFSMIDLEIYDAIDRGEWIVHFTGPGVPHDVDAERNGYTPLRLAIIYENNEIIRYLLDHGVDLASVEPLGADPCLEESPLTILLRYPHQEEDMLEFTERFIAQGLDIHRKYNVLGGNGRPNLTHLLNHAVTSDCSPGIVRILLDHGADFTNVNVLCPAPIVQYEWESKCTPLEALVQMFKFDFSDDAFFADQQVKFQHLVNMYSDISSIQVFREPLLFYLVEMLTPSGFDAVYYILSRQYDPLIKWPTHGKIALEMAIEKVFEFYPADNPENSVHKETGMAIVYTLLKAAKDHFQTTRPNRSMDAIEYNKICRNLLVRCTREGNEEIDDFITAGLLKHGSDPNTTDADGQSCLHILYSQELLREPCIINFIECGADINKGDNDGSTPLHMVCKKKRLMHVEDLLKRGADPNAQDKDGCTPLHLCMGVPFCGTDLGAIGAMFRHGANSKILDKNGRSAKDVLRVSFGSLIEDSDLLFNLLN